MSDLLRDGALVGIGGFFGAFGRLAGRWPALFANIGLNVGGCLLATAAGMAAARVLSST